MAGPATKSGMSASTGLLCLLCVAATTAALAPNIPFKPSKAVSLQLPHTAQHTSATTVQTAQHLGPAREREEAAAELPDHLALLLAASLEASGPLSLLATIVASAVFVHVPTDVDQLYASFSPEEVGCGIWIAIEAVFYLQCMALAATFSRDSGPVPFSQTSKGARLLWKRMLSDPSQQPRQFVESWHFDTNTAAPSASMLLLDWTKRMLGMSNVDERAPALPRVKDTPKDAPKSLIQAAAALMKPKVQRDYGISYDELSYGDVAHWMSRALFSKVRYRVRTALQPHTPLHRRTIACPPIDCAEGAARAR